MESENLKESFWYPTVKRICGYYENDFLGWGFAKNFENEPEINQKINEGSMLCVVVKEKQPELLRQRVGRTEFIYFDIKNTDIENIVAKIDDAFHKLQKEIITDIEFRNYCINNRKSK